MTTQCVVNTLTSEDEHNEVFSQDLAHLDLPTSNTFKRPKAVRKKKNAVNDTTSHGPSTLPNNIQMGFDAPVQNVSRALDDILTNHPLIMGQRRSSRVDYSVLHKHGRKEAKREGDEDAERGSRRE